MSLTYEAAVDEILDIFYTAWTPTGYKAFFESIRDDKDSTLDPFVYVSVRHSNGYQASLGSPVMYRRSGLVTFQVFTQISKGLSLSYPLAKVITDAYEGKSTPGGAWFRNVRINEIGRDGIFRQDNVLVEFEYDEVK